MLWKPFASMPCKIHLSALAVRDYMTFLQDMDHGSPGRSYRAHEMYQDRYVCLSPEQDSLHRKTTSESRLLLQLCLRHLVLDSLSLKITRCRDMKSLLNLFLPRLDFTPHFNLRYLLYLEPCRWYLLDPQALHQLCNIDDLSAAKLGLLWNPNWRDSGLAVGSFRCSILDLLASSLM